MRAESYFPCHRCGMSFLLTAPSNRAPWRQERLVCSECNITYGVTMQKRGPVICWLIREGGVRNIMGVKKIA